MVRSLTVPEFLYFFLDCFLGLMHSQLQALPPAWTTKQAKKNSLNSAQGGLAGLINSSTVMHVGSEESKVHLKDILSYQVCLSAGLKWRDWRHTVVLNSIKGV